MTVDRSRKRRLSELCFHQRCNSCVTHNHFCPLCQETDSSPPKLSKTNTMSTQNRTIARTKQSELKCRGVELTNISQESGFSSDGNLSSLSKLSEVDHRFVRKSEHKKWKDTEDTCETHTSSSVPSLDPSVLKPLYFEVPQTTTNNIIGREWVFHEIVEKLLLPEAPFRGALLEGGPGAGKTAIVLALVEKSCFGTTDDKNQDMSALNNFSSTATSLPSDPLMRTANSIVAYHFCQADNAPTCLVPEFVHSLSAQLSQAPQLSPYYNLMLTDPSLLPRLSLASCTSDPSKALVQGILDPLALLNHRNQLGGDPCVIVVDGLCEAEQHRPDYGDTLASFLRKHLAKFPPWLKLVCTVRSGLGEITTDMELYKISFSKTEGDERSNKDISDYITRRYNSSTAISSNIQHKDLDTNFLSLLTAYIVRRANGCFLYVKLLLDYIEKGHLVIKSDSFKLLPQTLSEIYQLAFNLIFSSSHSYEPVSRMLSISLASLQPVTLLELFNMFSALSVSPDLTWPEFLSMYQLVSEFLVMRADGSLMCFHPTLRDWLLRRRTQDSSKFLCNVRTGHAAIAFYLARTPNVPRYQKVIELAHHILKSNLHKKIEYETQVSYRDIQAFFLSVSEADISGALACTKNTYNPLPRVSRLLLLAGANPDQLTDHMDKCPLLGMYAYLGNMSMVSLLLEGGANSNLVNERGITPFSFASGSGHQEIVELLLKCGARIGQVDSEGESALVRAARYGQAHIVGYLLDLKWTSSQKYDVCVKEASMQALVAAAQNKQIKVFKMLLDLPYININTCDTLTGLTPLGAAAKSGDKRIVEMLLERKTNTTQWDVYDQAPLHNAAKEGNLEIVDLLLRNGTPVDQVDGRGRTSLMLSASYGKLEIVKLLLKRGSELDKCDKAGISLLSHAIVSNDSEVVKYVLDSGANRETKDSFGRSPLDLAIYQGNPDIVEILLEKGVDKEKEDKRGIRPIDRAIASGNTAIVTLFLTMGAKLSPASWMMAEGKPDIVLIILNQLLEEGNTLYRRNLFREASEKYKTAIKRLPGEVDQEWQQTFSQLRIHFLLNLSRCERRQGHLDEAVRLASKAIGSNLKCVDGLIARAKAYKANGHLSEALKDYSSALCAVPTNRGIYLAFLKLREEVKMKNQSNKNAFGVGSCDSMAYIDDTATNCSSV